MIQTLYKTKLPQWAERRMEQLQRERDAAVRELQEFRDGHKESNVYVNSYAATDEVYEKFFLQTDGVTFVLGKSTEIAVRIDGNELRINGSGLADSLLVRPCSGNVVAIRSARI